VPSRRKTREFVLQVLFAADAQEKDPLQVLDILAGHFNDDRDEVLRMGRVTKDFAADLIAAVSRDRKAIDDLIGRISHRWKLGRMSRVDRCVLRMAIAEMTGFSEIPERVTLNEAVDLAKKYGTENSGAFVNGILDGIRELKETDPTSRTPAELLAELDESNPTD
jgi:N utilization substance protein B